MPKSHHSRRSFLPWAVAAAVMVGNLFLHKPISNVCDAMFARLGRGPYERAMLIGIAALSVGGALFLLRGHIPTLLRARTALGLLALAAMSVFAQRWMLV